MYPMRLVGSLACVSLSAVAVVYTGEWHVWYIVALLVALTYPHVVRIIAGQIDRRHKLELRASLIDAFVLGTTVYVMGFSAIPTLSLLTIATYLRCSPGRARSSERILNLANRKHKPWTTMLRT